MQIPLKNTKLPLPAFMLLNLWTLGQSNLLNVNIRTKGFEIHCVGAFRWSSNKMFESEIKFPEIINLIVQQKPQKNIPTN